MNKNEILESPLETIIQTFQHRKPMNCKLWNKVAADKGEDHKDRPLIFAIDFDGTIVEDAFPEIGSLKEDAVSFINKVREGGHKWILWTVRTGDHLKKALKFLADNSILPDTVNSNVPEAIQFLGEDSRKVYADFYIDDKSVGLKWPSLD